MDKELDKLLIEYGNASFVCGEFDMDGDIDEYEELRRKANKARQAIIDYFENNQPTER